VLRKTLHKKCRVGIVQYFIQSQLYLNLYGVLMNYLILFVYILKRLVIIQKKYTIKGREEN